MKPLRSRLRRHLSYANVMASVAVFLALGGVGYAAATINGKQIVGHSIGAGKLKKGTLTSGQVKANALTGSVIDESTLSIVPQAQTAISATSATTATSAQTATTATTATSAKTATSAISAESATTAKSATTADSATTAAEADTLEGLTASQLQVRCPVETELFGGVCWDENPRSAHFWPIASLECAQAGGRLPSLSELVAYILRPGKQVTGPTWTNDLIDVNAGNPIVATGDEPIVDEPSNGSAPSGTSLGFRCVFYRVN